MASIAYCCGVTVSGVEEGGFTQCACGRIVGASPYEALRKRVSAMRELGVVVWGDITLGPPPPTEASFETSKVLTPEEEKKRYEDTLYASSE